MTMRVSANHIRRYISSARNVQSACDFYEIDDIKLTIAAKTA